MALIILRAVDLAAALLDGLFAHLAGYADTDTTRELIATYDATIEFFRSLLDPTQHIGLRGGYEQKMTGGLSEARTHGMKNFGARHREVLVAS